MKKKLMRKSMRNLMKNQKKRKKSKVYIQLFFLIFMALIMQSTPYNKAQVQAQFAQSINPSYNPPMSINPSYTPIQPLQVNLLNQPKYLSSGETVSSRLASLGYSLKTSSPFTAITSQQVSDTSKKIVQQGIDTGQIQVNSSGSNDLAKQVGSDIGDFISGVFGGFTQPLGQLSEDVGSATQKATSGLFTPVVIVGGIIALLLLTGKVKI